MPMSTSSNRPTRCDFAECSEAAEVRVSVGALCTISFGTQRTRHEWASHRHRSGSTVPDGRNPLSRSQKLSAISKIAMGTSNEYGFTVLPKPWKMKKTKADTPTHTDEITPQAANPLGIQRDFNHK